MLYIYAIRNIIDDKRYVGKTKSPKQRWSSHRTMLRNTVCPKNCNRHLFDAVKTYGIENFVFEILETIILNDNKLLSELEGAYILKLKTTDRQYGYNLNIDSYKKRIAHKETRLIMSKKFSGENNPNFNNHWDSKQKSTMSEIAKKRHASGDIYTHEWKKKISVASSNTWKNIELKKKMALNVKKVKQIYNFQQFDCHGNFIKTWETIDAIIKENPTYKWQNIYSVCNGYKKRIYGFVWKKVLKNEH